MSRSGLPTRRQHECPSAMARHTSSNSFTCPHALGAVYPGARRRRAEARTTLLYAGAAAGPPFPPNPWPRTLRGKARPMELVATPSKISTDPCHGIPTYIGCNPRM